MLRSRPPKLNANGLFLRAVTRLSRELFSVRRHVAGHRRPIVVTDAAAVDRLPERLLVRRADRIVLVGEHRVDLLCDRGVLAPGAEELDLRLDAANRLVDAD